MANKKYDNTKYFNRFKENNKDKINEKKVCELCGGKYSYFNKSHHNKSKKHLFGVLQNKLKQYENESNSNQQNSPTEK